MHLLPRQASQTCSDCPALCTCTAAPPPCSCNAGFQCSEIAQSCFACATYTCVPTSSSSTTTSSSGGISTGALAGAIVASVFCVLGAVVLYLWYRRRLRRKAEASVHETKPDIPAPAETVLNRPDPTEKPAPASTQLSVVRVYPSSSDEVIDLNPASRGVSTAGSAIASDAAVNSHTNPFDDGHSIQTTSTGTQGTNVIPIAFVPPGSVSTASPHSPSEPLPPTPTRPNRAPDLDLTAETDEAPAESTDRPIPVSRQSQISGLSGLSRNSYMSAASYSSDFLNEAALIVMQNAGPVRQVLGKAKAEVIHTPGSTPSSPGSVDSLKLPATSRPTPRSPLAVRSFGPADILYERNEEGEASVRGDPFGDEHSSSKERRVSLTPSTDTFGHRRAADNDDQLSFEAANRPWVDKNHADRASSIISQSGSDIVDIGSATRVNVGLVKGQTGQNSSFRTTMARLVSPMTAAQPTTLEEQQQMALAHAQAQALAQGLEGRRVSGSSVVSATSTRADSILESFPFVPPSPISSRPVRSPPRSPLHQQFSTTGVPAAANEAAHPDVQVPAFATQVETTPTQTRISEPRRPSNRPPPSRRILALSTVSQSSTASSGLGSFPFQIESSSSDGLSSRPPSSFPDRQRASLDTLALTSDLSSYPLGFDRKT